jgi:membrane-associated phospholipid phosphatase
MKKQGWCFWQPKKDLLKVLLSQKNGDKYLIFLNYIIWVFFAYLSVKILFYDLTTFFQLLIATVIAEIIEKIIKKKIYWRRPLFVRHDKTPPGLVDSWYQTGSFPSGHTIKAIYFFLLIMQFNIFNPFLFLLTVIPLLIFRILVGFHYPIDILGGAVIGIIIWLISNLIYVF